MKIGLLIGMFYCQKVIDMLKNNNSPKKNYNRMLTKIDNELALLQSKYDLTKLKV